MMPVPFLTLRILILALATLLFQPVSASTTSDLQRTEQLLTSSLRKKDWENAASQACTLGKLYWQEKKAEEAIKYLEQSLAYCKKADRRALMLEVHQQLGQIYTDINSAGKALSQHEKALKLARELNSTSAAYENLLKIATAYQQLNKPRKSIEPLEEALSLALRQNNLPLQQQAYELLVATHRLLGNDAKAEEYQSLLQLVKDQQVDKQTETQLRQTEEVLNSTKSSLEKTETSLLEANAINEMRQLEIDLLSKDKELAQLQINEQHARIEYAALIRNTSIAGLLMALAMITLLVRNRRKTLEANKKIEKQNKNISSSINYAKRIQEAMLPSTALQQTLLPDSFILFKPRDSVSGDFYLLTQVKSWYSPDVVIAAADCTGHGVPGAFMSLIGINTINGIVSRGVAESNLILEALDAEIRSSLQQETSGNNDGMDIALCIYRKAKNVLEFSGAKNPLVYIQSGVLHQIKGDIHAIGGRAGKKERTFKQHHLPIDQPTMVYLFSDGYRDQFGEGEKGKFMSKRFNQLLLDIHQLPLPEQQQILNKTFEEWKGTAPQTDDVLVIGLKLEPVKE
jgi:serine phosphatase RsbU (regulator of sigma subunit)